MHVGNDLISCRKKLNLTQIAAAEKLGIGIFRYSAFEWGCTPEPDDTILGIFLDFEEMATDPSYWNQTPKEK